MVFPPPPRRGGMVFTPQPLRTGMGFTPRMSPFALDRENFPPVSGYIQMPLHGVEMPEFIKDEELRKGPRHQNILVWMNAVQTHLDQFTSWDRRINGNLAARIHADEKTCQVARINPRYVESRHTFQLKNEAEYVQKDLEPAIALLVTHEKMRLEELIRLRAANANLDTSQSEPQTNGKKRKQEEDLEIQQAAKKRKQDTDKQLDALVDETQSLRKLVNEKTKTVDIEIRKGFHNLEGKILELMGSENRSSSFLRVLQM